MGDERAGRGAAGWLPAAAAAPDDDEEVYFYGQSMDGRAGGPSVCLSVLMSLCGPLFTDASVGEVAALLAVVAFVRYVSPLSAG